MEVGSATTIQFYVSANYPGPPAGSSTWPAGGPLNAIQIDRVNASARQLSPTRRRSSFIFSEIMYNPRARTDGKQLEFVELFNTSPMCHDISGFRLSGEVDYTFPEGTEIQGHGRIVVANNPTDLASEFDIVNLFGPFQGSLNNNGGRLRLRNDFDAILLEVDYDDRKPWTTLADGVGHSLVLSKPDLGESDPLAWTASQRIGGSPGGAIVQYDSPLTNVVINELLVHTDDPEFDYIELYNRGPQPVDVSGCYLTDDNATNKFQIPMGTIIPGYGFLSFHTITRCWGLSSLREGNPCF